MIDLFGGYDRREHVGYETFVSSVRRRSSRPVSFHKINELGHGQRGTNAFTFSRFMVPALCFNRGPALFCDASDQIMLADVAELWELFNPAFAMQVVQHPPYATLHPTKYVGTEMECPNVNYPRKNWASVMLLNCGHNAWKAPGFLDAIESGNIRHLLQLQFLHDDEIGSLPGEWNRLVDEGHPVEGAKLLHWTAGIPAFDHYRNAPGADLWRIESEATT